ncbi:hypothetical protein [Streptomyces halstedii]|uniref:hypothetical protein n=1 Tax=Streptomyces halstedii TaxID=1944 RepID=UPI003666F3C1
MTLTPTRTPYESELSAIVKNFTAVTLRGTTIYSKVRYVGLAGTAIMFGVGAFLVVAPGKGGEPLINRSLVGGTISMVIAWMAWVITIRPRLVMYGDTIRIRNWVTETVVPYGHITGVNIENGLTFTLKNGSEIRARVVGTSIVGELAGYPSAQLVRRHIQPLLSSGAHPEGGEVRETFSLSLKVPLIVAGLHVLLYGCMRYIFPMS